MLSYAFTTLKQSVYENIEKESFDNIHNLFAAILAKGIGLQLKQGLYREYINCVEDLTVVRGENRHARDYPEQAPGPAGRDL